MHRTLIIILLSALLLPGTLLAQRKTVSLDMENVPMERVFEALRSRGYSFVYQPKEIDSRRTVTVKASGESVEKVLARLFEGQDVSIAVKDGIIYLTRSHQEPKPAGITVSGMVVDGSGAGVIGAGVLVKGTLSGVTTDADGRFTIQGVSPGAVLEVSSLGYDTVDVAVEGRTSLTVELSESKLALDEIVVVGYGTQKKVNLTGSVAMVNLDDQTISRPGANISGVLTGMAPGVSVRQTTGKPGTSATIRVRGIGTLNDNNPLVLVDGVEWDMDNLNPADIESVSILKDAASTAIYGALGANGVILVTTRSGEGRIRFNYNGYVSIQNAVNKLRMVSDYAEFMELVNEGLTNIDYAAHYSQVTIDTWRQASKYPNAVNEFGVPNRIAYPNTEWFSVIFKPGISQNHHFTMAGSSRDIKYSVALGFTDNPGIMNVSEGVNSGQKKFTLQTKAEATVAKWLTMGTNIYGTRDNMGVASTANAFEYLSKAVPGIYPGEPFKYGFPASSEESTTANNLLNWLDRSGSDTRMNITASGFFTAKLYKGLQLEGRASYIIYRRETKSYGTDRTSTWDYVRNRRYAMESMSGLTVADNDYKSDQFNTDIILRYGATFGQKHEVGALAGYNTQHYRYKKLGASKKGMTDPSLTDLDAVANILSVSGESTEWAMASLFFRLNYAFGSRYLFETNLRYDGSSRFSPSSRWGLFPSVSAGWRISEERFMEKTRSWLDNLKLRASWGLVGNCRTSDYAWQAKYGSIPVVVGGSTVTGLAASKIGNENLRWEQTSSLDFGLDMAFLQNRLTAEFDWYDKKTDGILFVPSIPLTMGVVTPATENIAVVNNRGVELSVKYRGNVAGIEYSFGANAGFNQNMVLRYKGALTKGWNEDHTEFLNNYADVSESGFGGRICEGHMLGETYIQHLYRGTGDYDGTGVINLTAGPKDGIIRTESDMEWVRMMVEAGYKFQGIDRVSRNTLWYGDVIYADTNGDGNYGDTNDAFFSGHSYTPKVNAGFNLSLEWKGIDFYMLWAGSFGHYFIWPTSPSLDPGYNTYQFVVDNRYFYDPENPSDPRTNINSKFPRMKSRTGGTSSDLWEYKGDYFKLKNVQIGYTLPSTWMRKIRVDRLRIYATADNILTFTKFPGLDPEIGTSVTYPLMKQYAFGLQLTF
ncbi:MAG: TonB-dependent receptor [Bacteroidales bacterium]|nr:TonB-dependent receptor [Bacteroidales bacterium]